MRTPEKAEDPAKDRRSRKPFEDVNETGFDQKSDRDAGKITAAADAGSSITRVTVCSVHAF